MSRIASIKARLMNATMEMQNSKCPICDRQFRTITEYNISCIDAHHQGRKTTTISNACNSSYKRALTEFISGRCVWVHKDCHMIMHSVTNTGDNEKSYSPIQIDRIASDDMGIIKQAINDLR